MSLKKRSAQSRGKTKVLPRQATESVSACSSIMENLLNRTCQYWQRNGASPNAEPLIRQTGWKLTLCFRAQLTAWLIFILFGSGLVGILMLQQADPIPPRKFLFMCGAYLLMTSLAGYYVGFVHWYRVQVNEQQLELRRLLLPTRTMAWKDVQRFHYQPGDDTICLISHDHQKVSLYLTLHGLSLVRRCLKNLVPESDPVSVLWMDVDPTLMSDVPSWRCSEQDLHDNPFA